MRRHSLKSNVASLAAGCLIGLPLAFYADSIQHQKLHNVEAKSVVSDCVESNSRCDILVSERIIIRINQIENFLESQKNIIDLAIESNREKSQPIKQDKKDDSFFYIKEIPLSKDLQSYIWKTASKYKISPFLIYAMIEKESRYDSSAKSHDGHDYGLMQIRDCNHKGLNEVFKEDLNYLNSYDNVKAGIYMLKTAMKSSESLNGALMAYNMGIGGARSCWKQGTYSSSYSRSIIKIYNSMKERYENVN